MDYIKISGVAYSRRGVKYNAAVVVTERDSEVGSDLDDWMALSMACDRRNLTLEGVTKIDYISKADYDEFIGAKNISPMEKQA